MLRFEKETPLSVTAREAYDWHSRPGAFERLSPPWQRIEVIEPASALADGTRLVFRLYQGRIPLRWVAEHRDVESPSRFRDVQVEGPFASWQHTHSFEDSAEGCLLRDEIEFTMPLGALSEPLCGWKIRRDLERAFAFRHRTTAEDLALHARYRDRPRLKVAVTGASGLIGSALCALLTTGGHHVLRLVRREPRSPDEVRWDPASGVAEPRQLTGIDALVALGGESIASGRWNAGRKKRLVESRVDATRNLVASLRALDTPPATFVCASAVGFYGDRGDVAVDEGSPRGRGFLAELVESWESAAASAGELGTRVVSLRFGVVLSPRGGSLAKMLPPFLAGGGGPLGSGHQYLAWISIDDAAGAIHHALMNGELRGPVNAVAPEAVPQRRFATTLGRVLCRPAIVPAPAFVLRAVFGEMADETLLASTRAVPGKLTDSGYTFRQKELPVALAHVLGRGVS